MTNTNKVRSLWEPEVPEIVFVFGSNTRGIHGAGAARDAVDYWGAIYYHWSGLQGEAYAIPTLDGDFNQLPLDEIEEFVEEFMAFALVHPNTDFQVTAIGTGLAGFTAEQIAPMFRGAPKNVHLPLAWKGLVSSIGRPADKAS